MNDRDILPDTRFGSATTPPADWRADEDLDPDPDDELLDETPADVIEMLGFDPAKESEDDPGDDSDRRADAIDLGMPRGAGLMVRYSDKTGGGDDRVLFVRHGERDTWEFPGGTIEPGETAEQAAAREVREEVGAAPHGRMSLIVRDRLGGVDYSTFIANASAMFEPSLSEELTDWQWAAPTKPPEPLHPGVRLALKRLTMNELDLARAIASGEYSSPQVYENIWLYALRITGTGASYRPELREHVWRDPGIYLNADFLARCNGLAVIWEHPPGQSLTQAEFEKRVIGSIMLPYLFEDEVWGIAKIYDQDAAEMMLNVPLSTSPEVIFRDPGVNTVRKLENGRTLLIEGNPSLLDHLCVCELGVWDKGGEPRGIAVGEPEMADAKEELPENRSDSALHSSIDRFETSMKKLNETIDRWSGRKW